MNTEPACEYCGATAVQTGRTLQLDHFLPRCAGGKDERSNAVLACYPCNAAKSGKVFASVENARTWLHYKFWTSRRRTYLIHREYAFSGDPPAGLPAVLIKYPKKKQSEVVCPRCGNTGVVMRGPMPGSPCAHSTAP